MPAHKFRKSRGFTLIELLVVMVVLGLVAGIALTTVGSGNQSRELDNESTRLFGVLRMAADEAVFTNTEIGLLIEDQQYSFLEYEEDEGKWSPAGQSFLRAYTLPEWIEISFNREGKELALKKRQSASDENDTSSATVTPSKTPDIWLLSSGDLTPFDITLSLENDRDISRTITTNDDGEIVLPRPGDDA